MVEGLSDRQRRYAVPLESWTPALLIQWGDERLPVYYLWASHGFGVHGLSKKPGLS